MIRIGPSKREELRGSCLAIVANAKYGRVYKRMMTDQEYVLICMYIRDIERIINEATLRSRVWGWIKTKLKWREGI